MLVNNSLVDGDTAGCYFEAGLILAFLKEAKEASARRRSHEAIYFYDEILKIDPVNEAAWWGKGCEYLYIREHENIRHYLEEEISCYEMILSLFEDKYHFTWFEKAIVHEELDQISEAILCYRRFIEICDEDDSDDLEYGARTRIIQLSEKLVGSTE